MSDVNPTRKALILFIDDDAALRRLCRLSLERAGFDFVAAAGGREGLEAARRLRPDLILLDYMMPDLSGGEVFRELLKDGDESLRRTPVVMLTARAGGERERDELLEAGLAAYLHKPFGYRELLNVIDNVLVLSRVRERNRRLELEARRSFIATVKMLVSLLFAKDPCTGEHSKKAAMLAEAVALRCGLGEEGAMTVKLGALLHDVGKIGVPEDILRKPTALDEYEASQMRRHVHHGEEALAGAPHMEEVRRMVLHHHEWWDGTGYPAGLCGEEIPLGARVIAVVDAYDAMTSDRPYRRRLPLAVAVERLRAGAGTQFDPVIVGKLFEHLEAQGRDNEATEEDDLSLEFLEELQLMS